MPAGAFSPPDEPEQPLRIKMNCRIAKSAGRVTDVRGPFLPARQEPTLFERSHFFLLNQLKNEKINYFFFIYDTVQEQRLSNIIHMIIIIYMKINN